MKVIVGAYERPCGRLGGFTTVKLAEGKDGPMPEEAIIEKVKKSIQRLPGASDRAFALSCIEQGRFKVIR